MLDNGGEGSAATTAATPTAPRGVTLRAVRQVVTILEGRRKKQKIRQRRAKDDGNTLVSTISHASPQSAWWFKYTSNGILVDYGNEAKVKQSCERIVIFRKVIESKGKKIDLNWNFI